MNEKVYPKAISLMDIQKQVLKEMLDERMKKGEIKSQSEYQREWEAMMQKLSSRPTFMFPREQTDLTDAASFNETFHELELDLKALFQYLNEIDEAAGKHQRLHQSILNHLKRRIKQMENELSKYEELIEVQGAEYVHFETFIDNNQSESDPQYYTERNGNMIPMDYKAKWNAEQEAIKLPTVVSDNALIGPGGIRLGKVEIRKQLGRSLSEWESELHTIDHAIDTNPETFWAEHIVMDSPIQVDMGEEYFNVNFGALVELEIRFDYLTAINEIGLTMFGEYPLDIVGVKYFETDSEEEEPKILISPASTIPELSSRIIEGSTVYQFPDIQAKRMRIILNQRHYVKTDMILSEKEQRERALWIQARKGEKPERIELNEWEIDRIVELLNSDRSIPVTKYEYQYGLYQLRIQRNEYQPLGVYVSKAIPLQGNIKTVQLETKEHHPEHLAPLRLTDIEYYIHDGQRWYPILPMNQEKVYAELLFPTLVQGQYQAQTRFTIDGDYIIRKNGISVDGKAAVLPDNRTVVFAEYDASAYYTIEYKPTKGAWVIDFLQAYTDKNGNVQSNRIVEEFRGTDQKGRIRLSHYPFVDKAKLHVQPDDYNPSYLENEYIPIKIKMIDSSGYHIEQPMNEKDQEFRIENKTNYFESTSSRLEPYNENKGIFYQYEVVGNEIQFNTVIPESTRIIVEYPYLVSEVRVKAVLRRNIPGFHGLTPILYQYAAHFQTLR